MGINASTCGGEYGPCCVATAGAAGGEAHRLVDEHGGGVWSDPEKAIDLTGMIAARGPATAARQQVKCQNGPQGCEGYALSCELECLKVSVA